MNDASALNERIRIGVIGLGWVARNRHIPAIRRNKAFELVGVADHHPGRAAEVARKNKVKFFAEAETLADIPWADQVDAFVVATPPAAHAAFVTSALEAGKHVLTEKPFAISVIEGETMADAARRSGKILAVTHNFQFSRAMRALYDDLAMGQLGKLQRIAAVQLGNPRRRLPGWYETLPMGLFYDESPHFFYLLRGLAEGELTLRHAYAVAGQKGENTPSLINLLYRGPGAIPVTVDCQFDSAISEWYVRVSGDKGVGIVDIFRDIYIRLPNDGEHTAWQILRTSLCAIGQHLIQHIPNGLALGLGRLDYGNDDIYARFASAIESGDPAADISFDDALGVLKLQHEAIEEIRKNLFP